jgi:hypothetical protein
VQDTPVSNVDCILHVDAQVSSVQPNSAISHELNASLT